MRLRSPHERSRSFAILALFAILAAAAALTVRWPFSKAAAVGPNSEVTLVTDLAPDSPARLAAIRAIAREVVTTRREPAFTIEAVAGADFPTVRYHRNLIFVADLRASGPTAELVRELEAELESNPIAALPEAAVTKPIHCFQLRDPWARGQTVLVLAGEGEAPLAAAIHAEADSLYARFEAAVTGAVGVLLFAGGEEAELSRALAERHGFSLRIPRGYRVGEAQGARFVRLFMREHGARLLFVHWQDGAAVLPAPEHCLALRAELAHRYYEGDFIDSTRTTAAVGEFLGHEAIQLAGVWQNDRFTMGGPFRTYCFLDADRFVMIDLVVFAPDGSKAGLLRQLEAIARTYRDARHHERSGTARSQG
jgi:Domain of unknown function (DUF4837)